MNPHDDLGSALRALPLAQAPDDLWPRLAAALPPARRRKPLRAAWPVAIAAVLLLALIWPRSPLSPPSPSVAETQVTPAPAPADELPALRDRSQDLERWLGVLSRQSPQDARSLMAAAEIADLVGLVDAQLSVARDDQEAVPLWRQRVGLLEDLAAIRSLPVTALANQDAAIPDSIPL